MKKPSRYRRTYRVGISTKRLVLIGAAVFAFALAVSATSTYAFFEIQERYRIYGLEMDLDYEPEYLKVGKWESDVNAIHWLEEEETLTLKDFGMDDRLLGNVSNMFHDEYPEEGSKTFLPYFYDGYRPGGSTGKTTINEDGYVQMEFAVMTSRVAYLYLSEASAAEPNIDANVKAASTYGVLAEDLNNVTNAARMSFYSENLGYHIAELGTHEEVDYSGPLDLLGQGRYDVNENKEEILYGQKDGNPTYLSPLASDIEVNPGQRRNVFNSTHKEGTKMVDENSFKHFYEHAKPLADYVYDDSVFCEAPPLVALAPNTPTRLVVSIYLEGWDHDMTEALAYASFNFSLGFVAVFDDTAANDL